MSLCFPCAAFELRHRLDLALLTNQNGRYFYKMHLATLYMAQLPFVVFSQLGEVVRHSGLYEFYSCALCREVSHQGRKKGASLRRTPNHWGGPKSRNNVVNFFFNPIHLLPKYLRFKYGGAELVSCPGRNLTSVHTFVTPWTLRKNPIFGACTWVNIFSVITPDSWP